ncbi:MAG: GAF domain-containing protein [Methylomonas sp.]|nr:GAF domain-containing protein [Methylomonas sp.]
MSDQKLIQQIEKLIEIGIALTNEKNAEILLEKILLYAKSLTGADGGTLYRTEGSDMRIAIIHSDSLKIHLGGSSGKKADFAAVPLYMPDGSVNLNHVVCYSYHNKIAVNVLDVYDPDDDFDFSGPKEFDRQYHYRTKSLLTIPLKNHEGDIIGVLQLINAIDSVSGQVVDFDAVSQKITTAMASQAAIVLTQQQLIADLEKLFQSLVKLVATAIDQKSPYTGAHSRRVPVLTMMLAEAVHQTEQGPFKDFSLSDADRYELEIAAWLHDCGKITTPESVMDKATKLQTIFDRIALIETRFEVLKRDREIDMLKQKISALENAESSDSRAEQLLQQNLSRIDDDLTFIKRVNLGGEFLSDADQARIQQLRRQYHIALDSKIQPLLTDEEAYNLSISRGTLTREERDVINHHIVATIDMLGAIEFPKHLKNVPEYAGGHHERVDGKGYPRGLRREQMSVQARIMAIADVFEALTDPGRPYKPGKKLSESLAILKNMKEGGHIDPDLYDVFMAQKVYKKYADQYLAAEQIDVL